MHTYTWLFRFCMCNILYLENAHRYTWCFRFNTCNILNLESAHRYTWCFRFQQIFNILIMGSGHTYSLLFRFHISNIHCIWQLHKHTLYLASVHTYTWLLTFHICNMLNLFMEGYFSYCINLRSLPDAWRRVLDLTPYKDLLNVNPYNFICYCNMLLEIFETKCMNVNILHCMNFVVVWIYVATIDWVSYNLNRCPDRSCFPRTIITRVLNCGLKDFCSSGVEGADKDISSSRMKIPKMASVVGILGHLASKHSQDIRKALTNLFEVGIISFY